MEERASHLTQSQLRSELEQEISRLKGEIRVKQAINDQQLEVIKRNEAMQ